MFDVGGRQRFLPRRVDGPASLGIARLFIVVCFGLLAAYVLVMSIGQGAIKQGLDPSLGVQRLPDLKFGRKARELEEQIGVFKETAFTEPPAAWDVVVSKEQDSLYKDNRNAVSDTESEEKNMGSSIQDEEMDNSEGADSSEKDSEEPKEFPVQGDPDSLDDRTRLPLAHDLLCPVLPRYPVNDTRISRPPSRHYPRPRAYDRGACRCTPVANFVILSMQRSGSGWFETLLNSHENISSHGEVFNILPKKRERFEDVRAVLEDVYNLEKDGRNVNCTAAVGFKWMLNQGSMQHKELVADYFRANDIGVILLLRKNPLRRLISILANIYDRKKKLVGGQHKSHVHSREEAERLAQFRPTLNTKNLKANLQRVQKVGEDAKKAFADTRLMLLHYEDVMRDPEALVRVQEFLGLPIRQLQSKQVKIHSKELSEHIANWEAVVNVLEGTEFEQFLKDW